jgi:hypothetical protein
LFFSAYMLLASVIVGARVDLPSLGSRVLLPELFLNMLLAIPAAQMATALKRALFPPEVEIG